MMKILIFKICICLCFLCFCSILFSQNNYYVKDSTITYGSKDLEFYSNKTNSKFCIIKVGDSIVRYTPYQVSEYGFEDGQVFVAKKVYLPDSLQTVFLERLVAGRLILYYYEGQNYSTFFISKDSISLIELPRFSKNKNSDFIKQLSELTSDFTRFKETARLVKYNRISMKEFFRRLNEADSKYFPFFRMGINAGFQYIKLNLTQDFTNQYLSSLNYLYKSSFTAGFFTDIPLFPSSFSIYSGFNFAKHGFSYYKRIDNFDVDFVLNITTLKIPLMLKYAIEIGTYRPYVSAGLAINYHLRSAGEIHQTIITGNTVKYISSLKISPVDILQSGIIAETGVEKKLSYRNYLTLGLRYSRITGNYKSLGSSEICALLGITF